MAGKRRANFSESGSPSNKKSAGTEYLVELSLQHERYNKQLQTELEADEQRRSNSHQKALANAKHQHERVRRAAQQAQERYAAELEMAELREAQEAERHLQYLQEQKEREKRVHEEQLRAQRAKQQEEAQKAAELARKREQEEAAKARAQHQQQEQEAAEQRRQNEEAAKAAATKPEATPSAQEQKTSSAPPTNSSGATTNGATSAPQTAASAQSAEEEHKLYMKVFHHLKDHRKAVKDRLASDKRKKETIGDMRRKVNQCIGQLTPDPATVKAAREKIAPVLEQARNMGDYMVDVRPFLAQGIPSDINDRSTQVSGWLLFLLDHLTKSAIKQWDAESGARVATAEPIGVLLSYIFAGDSTRVNGHPLIDVLIAKFHRSCPILFGIYGNEKTAAGRESMGWYKNGQPKFSEAAYHQRIQGLAAGFASVAMRQFHPSARHKNPCPPSKYWQAIARIVNTPQQDVTQCHQLVLFALLVNSTKRFAEYYGTAAQVGLRTALVEFPKKCTAGPSKSALESLPQALLNENGFDLRL